MYRQRTTPTVGAISRTTFPCSISRTLTMTTLEGTSVSSQTSTAPPTPVEQISMFMVCVYYFENKKGIEIF